MRLTLLGAPTRPGRPHSSTEAWPLTGREHLTHADRVTGSLPVGSEVGAVTKGEDEMLAPMLRLSAPFTMPNALVA